MQTLAFRADDATLAAIERERERLARTVPGIDFSLSDLVKAMIARSDAAANPVDRE